jgi:hypothetical protein
MDMDHQGGDGDGDGEERQQLDDHRDEQDALSPPQEAGNQHLLLEAQGDRRRSLSLEIDRESPLQKQQSSLSSWRAAATSFHY